MIDGNSILSLDHIGIPTKDIEKTIDFYSRLGFSVLMRTVNKSSGELVAFLKKSNLIIETYQVENIATLTGVIDHICLGTNNVESLYSQMVSDGYNILGTGIEFLPFWENGIRFFKILGPNKEIIEFSQIL